MGSHPRLARPGLIAAACLLAASAGAGEADVIEAELVKRSAGRFDVHVTLRHADTGWDHYANRWEVVGPDGEVIATRVLYHPHVNEQPFTRSLRDVAIPQPVSWVKVRGHDLVHGLGGREVTVSVPH